MGDGIYVSGTLGGSAAELAVMERGAQWEFEERPQTFPQPRVELGRMLAKRQWATACIDVSDGLSTDLQHLAMASGVRAVLEPEQLPVAVAATLRQALHGGEDYELLFTAMAGVKVPKMLAGVPLTRIGTMITGKGIALGSEELTPQGWEHFHANEVPSGISQASE